MPRVEITISTTPKAESSFTMAVEVGWVQITDQWCRDVAAFFGRPSMIPEPGWPATTTVTGIAVIAPRPVDLSGA